MNALRCQRWTEQEFLASRERWQALLASSDADPLFQSWDWMQCWWRHHRAVLGADLCVFAFTNEAGNLVGIAPLYRMSALHLGWFRTRRLQLMGSAWRFDGAIFSEYLDVIAAADARAQVQEALRAALLSDADWDELTLGNVRGDSFAEQLAQSLTTVSYARRVEAMLARSVALPATFEQFAGQLASNTRRKLLHQRSKLAGAEFIELESGQWRQALERLERLVAQRFRRGERESAKAFHAELIAAVDQDSVRLTELRSEGRCVSVMLNLRAGATEYYLQSGFDVAFTRGLSPGYLHLGYAIEAACRDGMQRFDLLAGGGLHRDYKRDLAADTAPLSTIHVVRSGPLSTLFRVADRLRGRTDITSPA